MKNIINFIKDFYQFNQEMSYWAENEVREYNKHYRVKRERQDAIDRFHEAVVESLKR